MRGRSGDLVRARPAGGSVGITIHGEACSLQRPRQRSPDHAGQATLRPFSGSGILLARFPIGSWSPKPPVRRTPTRDVRSPHFTNHAPAAGGRPGGLQNLIWINIPIESPRQNASPSVDLPAIRPE
jgi:hypothetical protein